jgi:hypothetical protein
MRGVKNAIRRGSRSSILKQICTGQISETFTSTEEVQCLPWMSRGKPFTKKVQSEYWWSWGMWQEALVYSPHSSKQVDSKMQISREWVWKPVGMRVEHGGVITMDAMTPLEREDAYRSSILPVSSFWLFIHLLNMLCKRCLSFFFSTIHGPYTYYRHLIDKITDDHGRTEAGMVPPGT